MQHFFAKLVNAAPWRFFPSAWTLQVLRSEQHLTGKGVPYRVNQVPNSTRWQIFLRDPNNVEIEQFRD